LTGEVQVWKPPGASSSLHLKVAPDSALHEIETLPVSLMFTVPPGLVESEMSGPVVSWVQV
jgi:hypothetical protein